VSFRVIPRERAFYGLLGQAAAGVLEGARELLELAGDPAGGAARRARIEELEQAGDDLTHRIFALLDTTFVTPFDRSDIHELTSSLDDVLDAIEAVADLLVLHRIEEPLRSSASRSRCSWPRPGVSARSWAGSARWRRRTAPSSRSPTSSATATTCTGERWRRSTRETTERWTC
jgi:hypothetical protein